MAGMANGGGYEYQFVTPPPDWLMCNICQYPSKEPYVTDCCGNTFCKSCLDCVSRATTITNACPICRKEEFGTFPHKQADRTVRSLRVFCTNKEKGCEWQGEVNDIINHFDGCQFEEVTCSNDCGKCLQRQYLTSHVENDCVRRKVNCQYCLITGEHQFIEGEHKEQCLKVPIACPNKCKANKISREELDEHRKTCPHEEITCPIECGILIQRQYLATHVKTECPRLECDKKCDHISIDQQFTELQAQLLDYNEELTGKIESNIMAIRAELKVSKPPINSSDTNRLLAVTVANERKKIFEHFVWWSAILIVCVGVFIHFENSAVKDTYIQKYASIENKLLASQKRITELEIKLEQKSQQIDQFEKMIVDSITWHKSVDYKASKIMSEDQVVPVIVKMSEYNKKSDTFEWYSDPFYTHHKGYKLCLNVYRRDFNADLSLYLYLMKGPHDDDLRWPLRGRCEVILLNQISDSKHLVLNGTYSAGIKRVTTQKKINKQWRSYASIWYSYHFISNEVLHNVTSTCCYLSNDSMSFQVDYKLA